MSKKSRQGRATEPADPFPLIVYHEEETAVAVEEAPEVVEAPKAAEPVAVVAPVPVAKKKEEKKPAKAAKAFREPRAWWKPVLLLAGAAAAAGIVAAFLWKNPEPAAVEAPLQAAMAGEIEQFERSLVKVDAAAAVPGGLRYGFAAGDVLSYNFELVQNVTIRASALFVAEAERQGGRVSAAQPDTRVGWRLAGAADLAVYESGDRLTLGWRFRSMDLQIRGATDGADLSRLDALRAELNREVLVDMTPLGDVRALHFPAGTSAWTQSLLSSVVLTARMTLPDTDVRNWTAVEEDATGRFTASYAADTGYRSGDDAVARITRTRVSLDSVACHTASGPGTLPAGACRAGLDGGTIGLFDTLAGRFRTIRVDERMKLEGIEFAQEVQSTTAGGLRLTGAARDEGLAANGRSLAEGMRKSALAMKPGSADVAARLVGDAEQARVRSLTGGMTIEQALVRLEELANGEKMDSPEMEELADRLVAILRTSDAAAAVALEVILQREAHPMVRMALTDLLGAAETPAAQEALLAVVKETALEAELRQNALMGLAMADKPVAGAEAATRAIVERGSADAASEAALIGYGMLARSSVASSPTRSAELADSLRAAGRLSNDPAWQAHYLEALGNAGLQESLPEIERFLSRPETAARATFALRFVPSAEAALLRYASSDPTAEIRHAAVEALAFRETEGSRRALENAAMNDPSEKVRNAASRILGR